MPSFSRRKPSADKTAAPTKQICGVLRLAYSISRKAVVIAILLPLLSAVSASLGAVISATAINMLSAGNGFASILKAVSIGLFLVFLLTVTDAWLKKLVIPAQDEVVRETGMLVCRKTMELEYQDLISPVTNEIRSRLHNDRQWGTGFQNVFGQMSLFLQGGFGMAASFVLLAPLMTSGSWSLIICLAAVIIVNVVSAFLFTRYFGNKNLKLVDEYARIGAHFGYFIWRSLDRGNGKDVRLYNAEGLIQKHVEGDRGGKKAWMRKHIKTNGISVLASGLISLATSFSICLVIVGRSVSHGIPVGSAVLYISAFTAAVMNATRTMSGFGGLTVAAERQHGTLSYLNMRTIPSGEAAKLPTHRVPEIVFDNVSYAYPSCPDRGVKGVSFRVRPGKSVAVVGANGSGKSTLVSLLCRLLEPDEGRITLNGVDSRRCDPNDYWSRLSVVFQGFSLFPFSVKENITAHKEPDEEKLSRALELAGLRAKLRELTDGLSTALHSDYHKDGVDFSGGESQKLAFARALYKDAEFIILDEPAASLDQVAEREFMARFQTLSSEKGALLITHRLASCPFCDEILVLDGGRIVERGRHDELVRNEEGLYFKLWNEPMKTTGERTVLHGNASDRERSY